MKLSDLLFSDPELVLHDKDKNHYFELEYDSCIVEGLTESPTKVILLKGKRIYKSDLMR